MITFYVIIFLLLNTPWRASGSGETLVGVESRVYIMVGSDCLGEDASTNQLIVQGNRVNCIKFSIYTDKSIRNDEGNQCVYKGSGNKAIFGECSPPNSFEYDTTLRTYRDGVGDCWLSIEGKIKIQACSQQAFEPVSILPSVATTSTSSSGFTTYSADIQQPSPSLTPMLPTSALSVHQSPTSGLQSIPTSTSRLQATAVGTSTSLGVHQSPTSGLQSIPTSTSRLQSPTIAPSTSLKNSKPSTFTANIPNDNNNIYLASAGQQCDDYCNSVGKTCTTTIVTGNSDEVFTEEGVTCMDSETLKLWKHSYDPSYYLNGSICAGYVALNESGISCRSQEFNSTNIRRLCKCLTSGDEDNYSPWVPWSDCSATCNGGVQTRTRICNKEPCSSHTTEQRNCNTQPCPIDGGFSEWSPWSGCTRTCGGGFKNRQRDCTNPVPQYDGLGCFGDTTMSIVCNVQFCPVHGAWSQWTDWSACDKPCNNGNMKRWRFCNNPAPIYGGNDCFGNSTEQISCNNKPCPAENITVTDLRFDYIWNDNMTIGKSPAFNEFQDVLELNVQRVFNFSSVNRTYIKSAVSSLRQGSVVSTFTLYFTGLDSFQILLLQEAIEDDKYLGKLKILGSNFTYNASLVPSLAPVNFTLTPLTTTSIKAEWKEPPPQSHNGNVTGYVLFYREKLLVSQPFQSIATANLNVTLFGLKVFTEYVFRVLAYNENGNGIATKEKDVYTKESVPGQPPTAVLANGTSGFTATVYWTHIQPNEWNGIPVGTLIKFDDQNGHIGNVSVTYPDSSVILRDLIPVTTYVIDVCEVTAPGPGPCQRTQATTLPSPPSKAPQKITVKGNLWHNRMFITWDPIDLKYVHDDLSGYKILYRLNSIAGQADITSKMTVKVIHPSVTNVTLGSLQPNAKYSIQILAFNVIGDGVASFVKYGETCACPPTMYTNFAASAPFIYRDNSGNMQGLFAEILHNITQYTCGACSNAQSSSIDFQKNGKNGWAEKRSLGEMKKDIDDFVDISFPAFGSMELETYYGFQFVPVFSHPGVVYFIIKDTLSDQIYVMMEGILNTWPIFVVNILFIIISGYFIWALEFKSTTNDFRRNCLPGVLDGMYWAFITMGTHGYGDLVPRRLISKLFAIVWILIGMINMAIFTGALTTAITASQVYNDPKLYGVEVAAIQDSVAHKIGIYRNAKVNTKANYSTIEEVAMALKSRQVRGALVDLYSAASRPDLFASEDIIAKKNIKYPSAYGFVLSGNMENAAPSFRDYLKGQTNSIIKYIEKRTEGLEVNEEHGETVSMFDPESPFLARVLIIVSVLLVIGFIIGAIYYYWKKKHISKTVDTGYNSEIDVIQALCEQSITELELSVEEKVEKIFEVQLKDRAKFLSRDQKSKLKSFFHISKLKRECKSESISTELKATRTLIHDTTRFLGESPDFADFGHFSKACGSQRPSLHSHVSAFDVKTEVLPTVS